MKIKLSIVIVMIAATALISIACTSWQRSTSDVNITGEDIVYLKDERTEQCFAVLILANKVRTKVSEMSMTSVPCESLKSVRTR